MAEGLRVTDAKPKIRWWLYGLIAFAIVIALSIPLQLYTQFGISEHQAATTAARVDEIQRAWHAGGVFGLALISMIADLIFIGIYSLGAWIAGRSMAALPQSSVRILGYVVCVCAVVFAIADYTETVLQTIQMSQNAGKDWMAHTAATARPIKMAAFVFSFFAILIGIALNRTHVRTA